MVSRTVLVVDDEPVFLGLISAYLNKLGFTVLQADSLAQARQVLSLRPVDLLLCDLQLGDGNGLTLLEEVRDRWLDMPMIVLSGTADMADVTTALRLGASDFLNKPLDNLAVLEHCVKAVLERKQLQRENQRLAEELESAHVELELNLKLLEGNKLAGREVQQQLLPATMLDWQGLALRYQLLSASEVASQFIDYVLLGDRYLAVLVGQFGCNEHAAFCSVLAKSLFNQPMKQYRPGEPSVLLNPALFMQYFNGELLKSQLEQPFKAFYLLVDKVDNKLSFASAGYPQPLYLDCQVQQEHQQPPLGMFEWSRYQHQQQPFAAGQQLLLSSQPVTWEHPLNTKTSLCQQLALAEEGGRDQDLLLLALFNFS